METPPPPPAGEGLDLCVFSSTKNYTVGHVSFNTVYLECNLIKNITINLCLDVRRKEETKVWAQDLSVYCLLSFFVIFLIALSFSL